MSLNWFLQNITADFVCLSFIASLKFFVVFFVDLLMTDMPTQFCAEKSNHLQGLNFHALSPPQSSVSAPADCRQAA